MEKIKTHEELLRDFTTLDFDTDLEGKDKFLTPYLLENNYIKVLWGRQTVYVINNNLNYF